MSLDRVLMGSALMLLLGSAHALDGKKIFTEGGSQPGALPCVACHGADGAGLAAAGFPRLAGLPALYVRKQLEDFKRGSRANPVMQPLASALTEAEIDAVSQALEAMPGPVPKQSSVARCRTTLRKNSRSRARGNAKFPPAPVAMALAERVSATRFHRWPVNPPATWQPS